MNTENVLKGICIAAIVIGVYVVLKNCKNNESYSDKGYRPDGVQAHHPSSYTYQVRQNARYCPAGKEWCDSAHTCVPTGKCIDLCMFENKVWCHKKQQCIEPYRAC
jgi:hypothetical protein